MKHNKQTMLWSIVGEDLPGASFLFGTMHVRDSRVLEVSRLALEKIPLCNAFAAEFHLEEVTVDPHNHDLSHPVLAELITGRKYIRLRRSLLKSTGLDMDAWQHLPAFTIVNLVTERMFNTDMRFSLDEHLWNLAKEQDKLLLGIETFQEQLEILRMIPIEYQERMLLDLGINAGKFKRYLLRLSSHYMEGDVNLLFKMVKKNSKGLRKLLLYRRNEVMADRIAQFVCRQSTFCAVGAAHLGGGKGLIRLMKQKGFKLEPLKG